MTELVNPTTIAAPPTVGRTGELLDVATVTEGLSWLEPIALFPSYNCLSTDSIAVFPCPPNLLAAPTQTASSTNTTGGTLAAGTYRAVLTGVNARGETVVSNEISQVTTGATSRIIWNWNDLSGETSYNLWVTALNGATGTEKFLINLPAGTVTYNWTGTPAIGTATPPTLNTAVVTVSKTFEGLAWQDGFRFNAYAGLVCKGVGYNSSEGESEAVRVFDENESVALERALMVQRFVVGSSWAAPTDLTPAGGAVQPEVGLAILEGHASWNYAGVPTIHTPRSIGSLLMTRLAIESNGSAYVSKQGSLVASGGGYENPNQGPTGAAPTAGEKWMYASGGVVVARGETIVQSQMDRSTNEIFTLVERAYVAGVDCYASAVRVKVN